MPLRHLTVKTEYLYAPLPLSPYQMYHPVIRSVIPPSENHRLQGQQDRGWPWRG